MKANRKYYTEVAVLVWIIVTFSIVLVGAGVIAFTVGILDLAGVISIFNDPPADSWANIKRLAIIGGGIAAIILGFILIVIARVAEAVVDTAVNTAEMLAFLRQNSSPSTVA